MESHEFKEVNNPDGTYVREEKHTENPQETETFVRSAEETVGEPENKDNLMEFKENASFSSTGLVDDSSLGYSTFVRNLSDKTPDGIYEDSFGTGKSAGQQEYGFEQRGSGEPNGDLGKQLSSTPTVVTNSDAAFGTTGLQQRTPYQYADGDANGGQERKLESGEWPALQVTKSTPLDASAPPFIPPHLRRPDLALPHNAPGQPNMDSPMAEFDIDRRRTNSHGHIRPRRARPLTQHVADLIMWRNTKDSAVIFTFGTILLLSLSYFSLISIFAYLSMVTLMLITSFVLGKQVASAFQQQSTEHPFKGMIGKDVVISPEYAHQQLDGMLKPLNGMLVKVRNLYLADSLGQTLKLTFFMYILTYIGSWFNLLTLLTIVWIGAFSLPKLYEANKEQIDGVLDAVLEGLRDVRQQVMRAVNQQLVKLRPAMRRTASVKRGNGAPGKIRTQERKEVVEKME